MHILLIETFLNFSEVKENYLVHKLHDHPQICW